MLEDLLKAEEWAREVRRRMADWAFIESQPPRLREALKYLVEEGDLYVAARLAGLSVDEMDELRVRANIPIAV